MTILTLVPPPAADLDRCPRQVRNVALSFLALGLTAEEWLSVSPPDFATGQEIGAEMKALASS